MTFFSAVTVETFTVVLSVQSQRSGDWTWTLRIAKSNEVLDEGISVSKDAAQVAAQQSFEERLHRAGLDRYAPGEYLWKKQIGA
jgi:hypothetical protein